MKYLKSFESMIVSEFIDVKEELDNILLYLVEDKFNVLIKRTMVRDMKSYQIKKMNPDILIEISNSVNFALADVSDAILTINDYLKYLYDIVEIIYIVDGIEYQFAYNPIDYNDRNKKTTIIYPKDKIYIFYKLVKKD